MDEASFGVGFEVAANGVGPGDGLERRSRLLFFVRKVEDGFEGGGCALSVGKARERDGAVVCGDGKGAIGRAEIETCDGVHSCR